QPKAVHRPVCNVAKVRSRPLAPGKRHRIRSGKRRAGELRSFPLQCSCGHLQGNKPGAEFGDTMFRILASTLVCALTASAAAQTTTYIGHARLPYRGPVAYADKKLQVMVYAETDGRHVSAINFDGRVLWTRNPFVDAHLKPYRVAEPKIVY